jgi:hypothetical protein
MSARQHSTQLESEVNRGAQATGSSDPDVIGGIEARPLAFGTLFGSVHVDESLAQAKAFCATLGVTVDHLAIPSDSARVGTVGRIGVPAAAVAVMSKQRVLIGATLGADPLTPVPRLWRGLQRRAEVLLDLRQCTTLPGTACARAGVTRDVLLLSQRIQERATGRTGRSDENAEQWSRARQAAEMTFRIASKENRELLLVLPIGRSTPTQQLFADALERQARQHRANPPRAVKAGLLSALLSSDSGASRLLVASVMTISELSTTVAEAVGDTGPWPVISVGKDVLFYDIPAEPESQVTPLALMLVIVNLLQRAGRAELARQLLQATLVTTEAQWRLRDDDEHLLRAPATAFFDGIRANWGRVPYALMDRAVAAADTLRSESGMGTSGLRVRIETPLSAAALRDAVSAAVLPVGLEVASVRSVEGLLVPGVSSYDVRVRSQLGEPPLSDSAAIGIVRALAHPVKCVAVEPWNASASASAPTRPRSMAAD